MKLMFIPVSFLCEKQQVTVITHRNCRIATERLATLDEPSATPVKWLYINHREWILWQTISIRKMNITA